jgi:hypothetical protein
VVAIFVGFLRSIADGYYTVSSASCVYSNDNTTNCIWAIYLAGNNYWIGRLILTYYIPVVSGHLLNPEKMRISACWVKKLKRMV